MTENEIAGWHHRLNGHEFDRAQLDCEEEGHKESDITELLNSYKTTCHPDPDKMVTLRC